MSSNASVKVLVFIKPLQLQVLSAHRNGLVPSVFRSFSANPRVRLFLSLLPQIGQLMLGMGKLP
jgi:hypothetical protein